MSRSPAIRRSNSSASSGERSWNHMISVASAAIRRANPVTKFASLEMAARKRGVDEMAGARGERFRGALGRMIQSRPHPKVRRTSSCPRCRRRAGDVAALNLVDGLAALDGAEIGQNGGLALASTNFEVESESTLQGSEWTTTGRLKANRVPSATARLCSRRGGHFEPDHPGAADHPRSWGGRAARDVLRTFLRPRLRLRCHPGVALSARGHQLVGRGQTGSCSSPCTGRGTTRHG